MNKAMLITGLIILAAIAFGVLNVVSSYFSGNELDYYALKETTEASMTDAIDIGYYRISGALRLDKEKFVESLVRRLSQTVRDNRDYDIKIYDINETPPKVTVRIDSKTPASFDSTRATITNEVSAILETDYKTNKLIRQLLEEGRLDYTNVNS